MAKYYKHITYLCSTMITFMFSSLSYGFDIDKGNLGLEGSYYPKKGASNQGNGNYSLDLTFEIGHRTDNSFLQLTPFLRADALDSERNAIRFDEAYFEYYLDDNWTLNAGLRKVNWSVTEAATVLPAVVIDVINQRDLSGDPAGQEKLARLMFSGTYQQEDFSATLSILPYFEKRIYPSIEAREQFANGSLDLNGNDFYDSGSEESRLNVSLRLEAVKNDLNMAAVLYQGYAPEPVFSVNPSGSETDHLYYLMNMAGVSMQTAQGQWLYKSEVAYKDTTLNDNKKSNIPDSYWDAVLGIEHTLIQPDSQADLTLIGEYFYSSQDEDVLMDNDAFLGVRWTANDHKSTVITSGMLLDTKQRENVFYASYERRVLDDFSFELEGRYYEGSDGTLLSRFNDDHLIKARLQYNF